MSEATTSDKMEELRSLGLRCHETLRQLVEALGRLPDAPQPLPQTTGQRIAERMVEYWPAPSMTVVSDFTDLGGNRLKFEGTTSSTYTLRQYVAAAIDKAIADDRYAADDINAAGIAVEREACARLVDGLWSPCFQTMDTFARIAATAIRSRQ